MRKGAVRCVRAAPFSYLPDATSSDEDGFAAHTARRGESLDREAIQGRPHQRFENWKLRRALARPYFLRSTTRGSRVRKPAALTGARSVGS